MPPNNAVDDEDSLYISGTPLDRTMDKIGMGRLFSSNIHNRQL